MYMLVGFSHTLMSVGSCVPETDQKQGQRNQAPREDPSRAYSLLQDPDTVPPTTPGPLGSLSAPHQSLVIGRILTLTAPLLPT